VTALAATIAARIQREGPISFADFQEAALYDPEDGFFGRGGGAGRAGRDFVTSPEVGSLFGALVGRNLDRVWRELGEPDPFVVVEAGAGTGRLAADVVRAAPACAPALRYVLVERSAALRAEQRERLTIEPADEALGPFRRAAQPDEPDEPVHGVGPILTSLDELPTVHVDGVVLANELLDNLPVHLVERSGEGWSEVRVGVDGETFVEVLVPAAPDLAHAADGRDVGATATPGQRLPVPLAVRDWLASAAALLKRGEIVLIDYADSVAGLLERGMSSWLRTYRAHDRGASPLEDPGSQDITADLPLEYLRASAEHAGLRVVTDTTQADWLRDLGVDDLVAEGEATWRDGAHRGDLEAIAGRSRGVEAAALLDPGGLGAHRVLVLARG
jgi:SAM-dependent MidA family methyltransferase